jgi:aminoglycoside phosphotransferase (APT) family kinase protein
MSIPPLKDVQRLVAKAFPRRTVSDFSPLSGGLCNLNLKIDFASHEEPVVLRIYKRDLDVCRKEIEVLDLVRQTIPVPEVFYADCEGEDGCGPFTVLEYVRGMTFQQLKLSGDVTAIQQASYSAGTTLAAIGEYEFEKAGRLGPGLKIGEPYVQGSDPIPTLLDLSLSGQVLQQRINSDLATRLHELIWSWADRLKQLDDSSNRNRQLVHCDFGPSNVLVREVKGTWIVAAVLDWEFALSASPLIDVGHFLRYEQRSRPLREPYFSQGFLRCGGELPDDWSPVVKLLDLTALCDLLTRPDLPEEIVKELLDLIHDTLKEVPVA